MHFYLHTRIIRDCANRTIHVVQDAYLAIKHGFTDKSAPDIPLPYMKAPLRKAADGYTATASIKKQYQVAVGEALWPAIITRVEVAFQVGLPSRYLTNPTEQRLDCVLHLIRYL